MSETPQTAESKGRVTRSSIGAVSTETRGDEGSQAGRHTRSRTGTPTSLDSASGDTDTVKLRAKMGVTGPVAQPVRRLRSSNKLNSDEESDSFCWICRKDGIVISCQLCPRVYHFKCLGYTDSPTDDWVCIECEKIMRSECEDTKPRALIDFPLDKLLTALQYTLDRMMKVPNSEVFQVPVDPTLEPDYHKIISHPIDMSLLEKNIKKKVYGSTEAFLADAKWILHNSIVYNGTQNKYTGIAKTVLKTCRSNVMEMETCPDCYLSACTQENDWFAAPCKITHPLVWAKLKGYPFWPAKAVRETDGQVDCRFFGAHDKAWVQSSQVFLLSQEPPALVKNKKGSGFDDAMEELGIYIKKYEARHGKFTYAQPRELYKSSCLEIKLIESAVGITGGESRKRHASIDSNSTGGDSKKPKIPSDAPQISTSSTNSDSGVIPDSTTEPTVPALATEKQSLKVTEISQNKVDTALIKQPDNADVFGVNSDILKQVSRTTQVSSQVKTTLNQTESLLTDIEEKIQHKPASSSLEVEKTTPAVVSKEINEDNLKNKPATEQKSATQINEPTCESMEVDLSAAVKPSDEFTEHLTHTIDNMRERGLSEGDDSSNNSSAELEFEQLVSDDEGKAKVMTTFERKTADQLTKQLYIGMKGSIRDAVMASLRSSTSTNKTVITSPQVNYNNNHTPPDSNEADLTRDIDVVSSTDRLASETIQKLKWKHKSEIDSIKHNAELAAMEMRKSVESEKERALWRLRKQLEHKFKKIIEETKKKQWCAMCGKEAIFYCCWNTSYCDYPCQQKHWPAHLKTCAQIQKEGGPNVNNADGRKSPRNQSNGVASSEPSPNAPPPYSTAPESSGPLMAGALVAAPPVSQYQLMTAGQIQYMPVSSGTNPSPVYQAQVPVQGRQMQAVPPGGQPTGAPLLYPVMQSPSGAPIPPQPQRYLVSQRPPHRLAPKYS